MRHAPDAGPIHREGRNLSPEILLVRAAIRAVEIGMQQMIGQPAPFAGFQPEVHPGVRHRDGVNQPVPPDRRRQIDNLPEARFQRAWRSRRFGVVLITAGTAQIRAIQIRADIEVTARFPFGFVHPQRQAQKTLAGDRREPRLEQGRHAGRVAGPQMAHFGRHHPARLGNIRVNHENINRDRIAAHFIQRGDVPVQRQVNLFFGDRLRQAAEALVQLGAITTGH